MDFVTERSWLVFHLLQIQMQYLHWLTLPPSEWYHFPSYTQRQLFLEDMQVVNDCAERAVKDVGEFALKIRSTEDRDNLILVSSDHRGRVRGRH